MNFEFIDYDEKGMPTRVATDDGYCQTSRKFDEAEDGWMLDQLDPEDFEAIDTGRQMEALVREVNNLRRENFNLKRWR